MFYAVRYWSWCADVSENPDRFLICKNYDIAQRTWTRDSYTTNAVVPDWVEHVLAIGRVTSDSSLSDMMNVEKTSDEEAAWRCSGRNSNFVHLMPRKLAVKTTDYHCEKTVLGLPVVAGYVVQSELLMFLLIKQYKGRWQSSDAHIGRTDDACASQGLDVIRDSSVLLCNCVRYINDTCLIQLCHFFPPFPLLSSHSPPRVAWYRVHVLC